LDIAMATDAAFLLVSFGGPEGHDDVLPFLRNVTAGRDVPDERLAEVAGHYYRFGGISPINQQCRDLLDAIGGQFAASGLDLPLYWGNRNWKPYLADTLRSMAADGVSRVIACATSAYSSYSSCRQYLEDIDRAVCEVGDSAPAVRKIPPYYAHPAFAAAFVTSASRALAELPAGVADHADLVFTAHSIPQRMAAASGPSREVKWGRPPGPAEDGHAYPTQLAQVAGAVAATLGRDRWHLAYQSRSGPPAVPWLEPDINDCLTDLAKAGSAGVVVVPIGFVSDHMEVIFDLDLEAAQTARNLGLPMARAAAPGTDPRFVAMIAELAGHCLATWPDVVPASLGPDAARFCQAGCCGGAGRSAARGELGR
jgi:protoporphyrin/coproporphyrin ferrochelatase